MYVHVHHLRVWCAVWWKNTCCSKEGKCVHPDWGGPPIVTPFFFLFFPFFFIPHHSESPPW